MLDQLQSLRVFCQVAELGSFTAASERLGISKSSTTRHIQQLEKRLGVRLFHRTSRKISLTEIGRAYWESVEAILEDLDEAELSIAQEARMPVGKLRLTAPSWFSINRFGTILANFRRQYPQVELDIELSDRQVDIVNDGLDLALRVTRQLKTSLLTRELCPIGFCLTASPALVPPHLQHPDSLEGFPWLEYRYFPTDGRIQFGPQQVVLNTVMHSNSTTLLYHAVRSGVGLALLPRWLVEQDLLSGELLELFPEFPRTEAKLYALCSSRRYLSVRVQVFLELLEQSLKG